MSASTPKHCAKRYRAKVRFAEFSGIKYCWISYSSGFNKLFFYEGRWKEWKEKGPDERASFIKTINQWPYK